MNPNAKPFSFNPSAGEWKPPSAPAAIPLVPLSSGTSGGQLESKMEAVSLNILKPPSPPDDLDGK